MDKSFTKKLKNDRLTNSKWFIIIVFGLICGLVAFIAELPYEYSKVLFIVSVIILIFGFYLSLERIIVKIEGNNLLIENTIFFVKNKCYSIEKIKNLKYSRNVKSSSYTQSGHIKVLGVDVTPESLKEYYYHKEIVSFSYEGKEIEIGKWKKEFGGKKLVEIIKDKKQTKHNK
jgi:hypothetical protein